MEYKKIIVIVIIGLILVISSWWAWNNLMPCPEGTTRFNRLDGTYCASDSQKPCSAESDCPENEECISYDGEEWFCSGRFAGCMYRDPEEPYEICMD